MKIFITTFVFLAGLSVPGLAAADGDPKAGADVFSHACSFCHATGRIGAPKVGDKAAWANRIQEGQSRLEDHAFLGYRNMPARGDCDTCSDQDIMNAVAYMVEQSK